jgi:hypothetical protein
MIIPIRLWGRRQACSHSFSLSVLFGGKFGITSLRFSVPTRRSSGEGDGGELNCMGRVGNPIDLYDSDGELLMTSGDVFFELPPALGPWRLRLQPLFLAWS